MTQKPENMKKETYAATIVKHFPKTKLMKYEKEAVIADPNGFTLEGNTSPITAHGRGPKPKEMKIIC